MYIACALKGSYSLNHVLYVRLTLITACDCVGFVVTLQQLLKNSVARCMIGMAESRI